MLGAFLLVCVFIAGLVIGGFAALYLVEYW